jgi:CO/xanthine dehydrogenase Mo-binding subunit
VGRPVKLVWSRESDMTQGFYRPVYAVHTRGAADASGAPVALDLHALSQSITLSSTDMMRASMPGIPHAIRNRFADVLNAMFATDTIPDMFASEGLSNSPYKLGNFHVAATPVETKLPVATWRSVGNSVTGFVMECLVDELAHAAKQDPFTFRKKMLDPKSKQTRVLERLASLASWGTPAPTGIGRGLARHFCFYTEVAQVAEVEIVDGRIRVRRVFAVVDCGIAVNPDIVKSQVEGAVIFGLSAALDQEITLVDGVVQQTNFDTYPLLRMHEVPEIIVDILPSDMPPTGIGEPGLPPIAPAVANAVFALTGKRLRRMPLQRAFAEGGAS